MLGLGLGLQFSSRPLGVRLDPQAVTHYDRVIADGGIVPAGLQGCNEFFVRLKYFLGVSDITTVELAVYDEHYLGCRLGNGAGITSGQAIDKKYSACGASTDLVQTTAASQPLLLIHSGVNYYQTVGVSNNYVSTPNATANQITEDIDIIAYIDYKTNGTYQIIVSKSNGLFSGMGYSFYINNDKLELEIGNPQAAIISSVSLGSTYIGWVRMTRVKTTGVVKFYTSNDSINTSLTSINWVQNGTDQSLLPNTAINNSYVDLLIGVYGNGTLLPFSGKIYRTAISNTIGGNPVVDFNPESFSVSDNQTQWTSVTGEVWTITTNGGNLDTGYCNVMVTKTISQADGIDDNLQVTGLSPIQYLSTYVASRKFATASTRSPIFLTVGSVATVDAHATWFNANLFSIYNGAVLNSTENSVDTIVLTANFDNTNSSNLVNDSDKITGSTGTFSGDSITTYGPRGAVSQCISGIVSTTIVSKQVDSVPINTALFQFIREFNNNFAI